MFLRSFRPLAAPALVGACLTLASSAHAGMVVGLQATQGGSALPGQNYSTFDGQTLGTSSQVTDSGLSVALAGGAAFVRGSSSSRYAPPTFSGSNNSFFYPNASTSTTPPDGPDATTYVSTGVGSITFSKAGGGSLGTYFGLLWGSVDTYNSLTFNFADGTSETITGSQVGVANGSSTYYVNVTTDSAISSVVAKSSSYAFEVDNVAYGSGAVPEPASMAMVGIGLAGVGLATRRRHRRA